jgi:anaerobic selenocysteine-containing dehydrogenase
VLNYGCNSVLGIANPEAQEEFLKKIPFIVSWDLFDNEFSEGFADILLPDTSYLETFTFVDGQGFNFNYPFAMEPWCYHITQPVVEPEQKRRYIMDVSFDLLDQLGKRAEVNEFWNRFIGLGGEEKIKPDEHVTWEQVGDKALQHYFGRRRGTGVVQRAWLHHGQRVEEAYWRWFVNARVPIYLEFMVDLRNR